ncbi:hypothetical protein [Yoonia sp. 2307UL14-13]|uniref:hypothetical protein n=1 Tax=Yoonia sp. 2307UL14-13 TaxID=3126506 RepID=UPI0030A4F3A6
MRDDQRPVRQRRVFHIPGYDPIHPRRYRELYRTEGAKQAEIGGYEIAVKAAQSEDTFRWAVKTRIDGVETVARIDVLVWSDIVRKSMAQTIPATYWQLLRTAWIYIATGTLRRLMWMRKGPVIAALYPVFMLLGQLLIAIVLGLYLGGWAEAGVLWFQRLFGLTDGFFFALFGWIGFALKCAILLGMVLTLLHWFKSKDSRLYAYYLMHDYAFSAGKWGATPPELQARMDLFAETIAAALSSDVDEVLVVGHSSGAHLAIAVVADLIREGRVPTDGPRLALLTLGQVVPMVSFLPDARELRRDLAFLAGQDRVAWVDVSAPGDGCSFALCDPVAVTGVTPPGKKWPLILSASFTQTLKPETWRKLRWRFFRLHFQYLCAFDQPKDYDYFQITAGPVSLAERYRGRAPSKSRIDVPASKYTSLAP